MFYNAYGCAADAVSIRRNAFLAIFTWIELIFLSLKILKLLHQAFVLHIIFLMKVKSCWSVEHNTSKYQLEKCQFNIGSYGTHSVLDTPDLWANIVLYVAVAFPIQINEKGVLKLLESLKIHKAAGPDQIAARILKQLTSVISPMLTSIYKRSYVTDEIPQDWRSADITPVFKKGKTSMSSDMAQVTCLKDEYNLK